MTSGRVITYDEVVRVAERLFHATGGLDMAALARAASISRATLYRVAGSRDRVLGDVLWGQGSRLLTRVVTDLPGSGLERLLEVAERFNRELLAYAPLRTFLREDPDTAFRVLFMAEARVHARFVDRWRGLLEQAQADGHRLPLDVDDAAYVLVRLGESVLYSELLGHRAPDLELAARMQRAVLHR